MSSPIASSSADPNDTSASPIRGFMQRGLRNLSEGEPGKRGEMYVGIQLVALVLIVFGDLPGLPLLRLLHLLLGPLCASTGTLLAATAAFSMGASFSPWPMPVAENVMQTTGIYAIVRHPMYVGLTMLAVGCATLAQSIPRAVVAALLALLLRAQAIVEEQQMRERYGSAWDAYVVKTPRFLPAALKGRLFLDRLEKLWSGQRS